MTSRPDRPTVFLQMAATLAARTTCRRRAVGCVLTDEQHRVLAVGHNGVPPGVVHCTDVPCPGANEVSGGGLDRCEAHHAELAALLFCPDVTKVAAAYVTASPCLACVKSLLMTPCQRVYFWEAYPHEEARVRWEREGRLWLKVPR